MIIIQCHAVVKEKELNQLQRNFVAQANDNIIVLPPFCTLKAVTQPDDDPNIIVEER